MRLRKALLAGSVLAACLALLPAVRYALAVHALRQRKRWEEEEGLV